MKNDVDWSLYRSFLAVMEAGSLSAAGRRLRISQPTMGRHIRTLEAALEQSLFLRTPDGLSPTDAALALMPHAQALSDAAGALTRAASGGRDVMEGSIRIAASEVTAAEILPPIVRALMDRWPGLVVELAVSNSDEDVMRRAADIAVRMAPPRQDALVAARIGAFELGLYAHPAYLHGRPAVERADDLQAHRLIGFDRPFAYTDIFRVAGKRIARDRFALHGEFAPHADGRAQVLAPRAADTHAEEARQLRVVPHLRVHVQRQVRAVHGDPAAHQRRDLAPPAPRERGARPPEEPVMDEQQIGVLPRRLPDHRLARIHRHRHAADLPVVLDLESVHRLRVVRDIAHAQVAVEIGDELRQLHRGRPATGMESSTNSTRGTRKVPATIESRAAAIRARSAGGTRSVIVGL